MVGAGFIGQLAHLMNYVEVAECDLVALAELRPELRRRVAQRYCIPRTYATHHELLQDPDVEAVVVVTPRQYTGPVALDCLNAAKHVLTEKPMAGTLQQGETLVAAAEERQVHYAVGYMKRYDEGVQTAKQMLDQLVESQELGPVLFARAHCYMGESYCNADGHIVTGEHTEYPDVGWPIGPEWLPAELHRESAAFLNTYSHNFNLLRYLFGSEPEVESVHFSQPAGRIAVLRFDSFVASLELGKTSFRGWDETTEIYFADGRLRILTPPALLKNTPATVELYKGGEVQEQVAPQCNWSWSFRRQAEAFVGDVLHDRASISSAADALVDVRLHEAMWRMHVDPLAQSARP